MPPRRAARSARSTRFRRRTAGGSCSSATTAGRDDYARDAAYQRTLIDQNGNPVLEPAYGIFNARFVYEPAARNYSVELWGKNLHGRAVHQRRLRHARHVGLRLLDRRPLARSRCELELYVLAIARLTETEAATGRLFLLRASGGARPPRRSS